MDRRLPANVSDSLSGSDSCPICYDECMATPKALHCLHSFCLSCLQSYIMINIKRDAGGWYIHCPVCRTISRPSDKECNPVNMAAAFPTNFYIKRRPSPTERQKVVTKNKNAFCCLCPESDRKPVEWFCRPCKQTICGSCLFEHEKDETTTHQLSKLSDILGNSSNDVTSCIICPDHEGKPAYMFCVGCLVAVCDTCLINSHNQCTISFLQKDRGRLVADLETKTKELTAVGDSVWHWSTHAGRCRDDITRKIASVVDEAIASLERNKANVLSQLDSLYESQQAFLQFMRLSTVTDIKTLNIHVKQVQSALRPNDEICLLSKNDFRIRLPKIKILDTRHLNMELNFQPNVSFLRGVLSLSDFNLGTVWLEAGRWPDPQPFLSLSENIHQWLSSNRAKLVSRFSLSDSFNSCNLLTLVFDKYIILTDVDRPWLWKYNFDGGQLLGTEMDFAISGVCSWTERQRIVVTAPSARQLVFLKPEDLSTIEVLLTKKSYSAITSASNTCLAGFDTSSTSIDILSPRSCGIEVLKSVEISSVHLPDPRGHVYLLTTPDKDFLIVDSTQKRLLCLDSKGALKFAHEQSGTPAVCTDKKYIYSCDNCHNTVSRLTLCGQLDCILLTAEDGLDHPTGLYINEDGHLVIVQGRISKSALVFNMYPSM